VNGCETGGPEPNRLGTARRLLLARVSSEELPPSPAPATEARPTESVRDRHRAALSLLRAGTSSEEVARRERLLPGDLRLMSNLVAAEAELAGARG
jgi:hypothetical protein